MRAHDLIPDPLGHLQSPAQMLLCVLESDRPELVPAEHVERDREVAAVPEWLEPSERPRRPWKHVVEIPRLLGDVRELCLDAACIPVVAELLVERERRLERTRHLAVGDRFLPRRRVGLPEARQLVLRKPDSLGEIERGAEPAHRFPLLPEP